MTESAKINLTREKGRGTKDKGDLTINIAEEDV